MTDVILFHHAQGRTAGVEAFADRLRAAGHPVTVPDLYGGATFDTLDEGVGHAEGIGMEELIALGVAAAAHMPQRCVYAGFSLGMLPAQKLAQTRRGALGAVLYHGGLPVSQFGEQWPDGVALQLHVAEGDKWAEPDVVKELAEEVPDAQLYLYPGSAHLVADHTLAEYDEATAQLIIDRTIELLDRLG